MRWTQRALTSFLTFYNIVLRWQPLLWQRQRSGAKSLLQTRYAVERALLFRLCVLSSFIVVLYVRALLTEGYMREIIFSVKFYHLSLYTRGTLSSQKRGKGATKRILLRRRGDVSRYVWRSFWTKMKDLLLISLFVLGSSILRPFKEKKSAMNGWWWEVDVIHFLGKDQISLGSTFHFTRSLRLLSVSNRPSNWPKSSITLLYFYCLFET